MSLKVYIIFICLFIHGAVVSQTFQNVQLPLSKEATYFYSQVEPSIFINPNNPKKIVAGSVMNDYYYSKDAGKTWKVKSIYAKSGVNGDPCLIADDKYYYYFHLSNINGESLKGGMVCQRSKSYKGKFKKESHTLVNGKFHDKEWAVINSLNGEIYLTWTQFDAYDSTDPRDRSNILFSKSKDRGLTWSTPLVISKYSGDCADDDLTAEGAVPAVGPNGEIYVAWARNSKIWFNASFDGGLTWLAEEQEIADQKNGWVLNIPGIYRCNGLPITLCDNSSSSYKGTIYVNWGDQRNGDKNTDIWVKKSNDKGKTWSKPIKINTDDSQKHQFLSWMTIDPITGYVYCVFYDRRNHENNKTDVYLAVSKNGGDSFENYKISENSFLPSDKIFFGDYINISVHNGMIRPIWMSLNEDKIKLFTALIDQGQLDQIVSKPSSDTEK